MFKFFVVILACVSFICTANANPLFKGNDVAALKTAIAEKQNNKLSDKDIAMISLRLAYLQDAKKVDTVEKIESIIKGCIKLNEDKVATFVARAVIATNMPDNILVKVANSYKNVQYVKIWYFGRNYPANNTYTLEQKKNGALEAINFFYAKNNQEKFVERFLVNYLSYTESMDSAVIKNDLLPIYRKILVKIPDNPKYKLVATKIGLALKASGVDVK